LHLPDTQNTQKIELKHLTLPVRMKRYVRKTICFLTLMQMHSLALGVCMTTMPLDGDVTVAISRFPRI
jgi:IS1 family transposase